MTTGFTAATRLVVLLGHPVAHSRSPQIHNAAFAAAGVDAVYVACDVPEGAIADAVRGLRALGALGANITVPHKQAAWELADERTPEAELVGAANTLFWDGDRLVADNTDVAGLTRVLVDDPGLRPGDPVALLGAGGAARAAAVAFGRAGVALQIVARRPRAAADVAAIAERSGAEQVTVRRVGESGPRPRVVVNATPLGLHGEPLPDEFMHLDAEQVALDLVYGMAATPFLSAARQAGAPAFDGLGMLIGQAGPAFTRWTGRPAPLGVMADAARRTPSA